MIAAMKEIQSTYGGGNITEPQLEADFHAGAAEAERVLQRAARRSSSRSGSTPRTRPAARVNKPQITGPGLNGPGFTCAQGHAGEPGRRERLVHEPGERRLVGLPDRDVASDGDEERLRRRDGLDRRRRTASRAGSRSRRPRRSSAAAAAGATNVKVASVTGLVAGTTITVDSGWGEPGDGHGDHRRARAGSGGTGITFTPALAFAHASAAAVSGVVGNSGLVSESFNVDTTAPVTTATLTPGIHNGWYASPTLTLTVNDGNGSGNTVDPCPPAPPAASRPSSRSTALRSARTARRRRSRPATTRCCTARRMRRPGRGDEADRLQGGLGQADREHRQAG